MCIKQESSVKSLFQSAQPSLSAKQLLKSGDSKDSKSSKKDKDKDKEKAVDISDAGGTKIIILGILVIICDLLYYIHK